MTNETNKKDIIDSLIRYELMKLDDICEALEGLSLITLPDWKPYATESDAYNWFESNPPIPMKKHLLQKLGYDVAKL